MPELLDLFCCAGGAARGYQKAGFRVTGVDIYPRASYCGDMFVHADALEFLYSCAIRYDFIHASPPCQAFSTATGGYVYPNYIPELRELLNATGSPWVIENVVQAVRLGPMRRDLMLCGEMFELPVIRHRVFEFGGWDCPQPVHPKHRGTTKGAGRRSRGNYTADGYYFGIYGEGTDRGTTAEWQQAMQIDWTDVRHEIAEAIPPAYTEYIGRQFLESR